MARLADDSGTGTRRNVPTPTIPRPSSPSSVRAADEAGATTPAATESPAFQNQPTRDLTAEERAAKLKADREAAYRAAQEASKGTKPDAPAEDANFTYDYVWRQDVGAPTGKWVLVRYPKAGTGSTDTGGAGAGGDGAGGSAGGGGAGSSGGGSNTPGASTTYTAPDGKIFTDLNAYNTYLAKLKSDQKAAAGESAFTIFRNYLNQFGLGALASDVEKYKIEGLSDQELLMKLRTESTAYKTRFIANEQRIKAGLRALSEAEYIGLEDKYQDVMRRYGMPESYYSRGDLGRQAGFEKFIAGDVSPAELEDRIQTAQDRLLNAAPEIMNQLKGYYNVTQGDILSYILDPQNALPQIKRRVQAAEIGGAAVQSGLAVDRARAEQLAQGGVTGAAYKQASPFIKQAAERGSQLAAIYKQQPYTQQTAEAAALKVGDYASALEQTNQLGALESATFRGSTGAAGGALARERAGQF